MRKVRHVINGYRSATNCICLEGEVIAVGEGKYRDDGSRRTLDVKAGDRVLFGKYIGSEIKIDGE